MPLTPKQEAFALAYAETGNASEAYRRSYNAENMKPEVVANKASALLKKGDVRVRVEQLQANAAERHDLTVDDLLRELEEARTAASTSDKPQAAAMVAATMGKAKLLGYLTEKVEHSGEIKTPELRLVLHGATSTAKTNGGVS
ncbi:terminase small subunit [Comamonas odontotermitis]|uniref:terminase small subunit n=1 Tax=Comamonas odontotermitis TaxID=379895 RepID=UPI001CC3416E|nr:terminase small subunit [Comamonas odontotermitis]UBB18356.1 terminase small subunit [Comamonas odontotermitis]